MLQQEAVSEQEYRFHRNVQVLQRFQHQTIVHHKKVLKALLYRDWNTHALAIQRKQFALALTYDTDYVVKSTNFKYSSRLFVYTVTQKERGGERSLHKRETRLKIRPLQLNGWPRLLCFYPIMVSSLENNRRLFMGRFYTSFTSIGRYTLVRLASRGGDYLISTSLITLYGSQWFFPAIALSSSFNISIDYLGQKFWAFKQANPTTKRRSAREIVLYLSLRGLYAVPAFLSLFLLYKILEVPYAVSALLVTGVLWFISFESFQGVFTGSTRRLPSVVRQARIIILKRART